MSHIDITGNTPNPENKSSEKSNSNSDFDPVFEQEIAMLYQQRQQQISPPKINLVNPVAKTTGKSKYSIKQLLTFIAFGSFASFGIFAMITYLVKPVDQSEANTVSVQSVNYIQLTPKTLTPKENEQTIVFTEAPRVIVKPVLPQLPQINTREIIPSDDKELVIGSNNIDLSMVQPEVFQAPKLAEPSIPLVPEYKVMPKYRISPNKVKQFGEVKLGYQITAQGDVVNVAVIESSVNKELQKSAKTALSQWRFANKGAKNGAQINVPLKQYEIVFKFKKH